MTKTVDKIFGEGTEVKIRMNKTVDKIFGEGN